MENYYKPSQVIDEPSKLIIDKDLEIPIPLQSGIPAITLRGDLYRPLAAKDEKLPVIITMSPYGKDIHYHVNSLLYSTIAFVDD